MEFVFADRVPEVLAEMLQGVVSNSASAASNKVVAETPGEGGISQPLIITTLG